MKLWFENEPKRVWVQTSEGNIDLEKKDCWRGNGCQVWLAPGDNPTEMNISLTAEKSELMRVYIAWDMEAPADIRIMGDHWERGYGDLEFRGIAPERALPWYFIAESNAGLYAAGVKTGCNAFCHFKLTRDRLVLCLDVRNGGMGVLLNNRVLEAATLVHMPGTQDETIFGFTRRFLKTLCPNPIMPKQPMYGGNNWYYAYGISSAEEIMEDTRLVSSLASNTSNRPWMFIDDGWQICRNANFTGGPWHEGNYKFPDLPGLCDKMKSEGVKTGIWIRPLLNFCDFPVSWRLPQSRFLARELGGEYQTFMDPSVPDVLEWIKTDIARIRSWGFDAIKHDYTTYDILGRWGFDMGMEMTNSDWCFSDRSLTTMEIILNLYRAIREASDSMLVLGCNTISHAAAGLCEVQRTGDDTSGREWERTRKMGVNTLAFRAAQHGLFYAADADCVGVTPAIPWHLNKQWLDLVARSGTPLLVSIDPKTATAEQKRDVAKAFEQASKEQILAEPLDWLHTSCPSEYLLNGEYTRFRWDGNSITSNSRTEEIA